MQNPPVFQANLQAAQAHLFKLAAINDYQPEYDVQKLPKLEAFLVAVKGAIDSGNIATPQHYTAGVHKIDGHDHKIKLMSDSLMSKKSCSFSTR